MEIGRGGWGLELNFLGFQIEETFEMQSFYLKLSLAKKFFPQNHRSPQKTHFFENFSLDMISWVILN